MHPEIRRIIEAESQAILNIPPDNDFEGAVKLIYRQVHQQQGKVITSGLGKAGQVARNLASTLSATGTPSVFLHPSDAQHGDLGLLHPHDALLLISNSGKTRELLELVTLAENLHGDNPVIVITGDLDSPLAQNAEVSLFTGGPPEICPLELTPTTSITTMMVICHIITISLIHMTGFTRQEFFKRHHGGYLGSLKNQ
ncbi:MAG: SIS domain-containing protein [Bacteroidia bacterium]